MLGRSFTADDTPAPEDAYGISKAEAEAGLHAIARKTGMELVIIRPPLVYGPGVKGNFQYVALGGAGRAFAFGGGHCQWAQLGGAGQSGQLDRHLHAASTGGGAGVLRRRWRGCIHCRVTAPYCASAGAVSALCCGVRLEWWSLRPVCWGKGDVAQRLLGSLQVDISKNRNLLGWQPLINLDEGLRRAVQEAR